MRSLEISFVGDISLNGVYDQLLDRSGRLFPFVRVKEAFAESNLVSGNLESPLVSGGVSPAFEMKTPLRGDPEYAEALRWAGFGILNLSNNHILDYGKEGVDSTQSALNNHGIRCFGYGDDLDAAKEMKIVYSNGLKIGFVGYTDVVIDSPFYANSEKGGIAGFDINLATREIQKNKRLVDILVVNLHWGIEYFWLPTPVQRAQARKIVDAGADIIVGHHPHIVQGVERYKRGIIAYSLGNFVFGDIVWEWKTENGEMRITNYKFRRVHRESLILRVAFKEKGDIEYAFAGAYVAKSGQVVTENRRVESRVISLSNELSREDYEGYFAKELKKFRRRQVITKVISRLKKFYKLRPKHLRELKALMSKRKA